MTICFWRNKFWLLKEVSVSLHWGSESLQIISSLSLSLSLSLAVTSPVITSLTSPNSSSIWEFVAVFYDAPPPSQVIICIFMEISLFTIWSIYHLSFSSEARWQQWWPHQRLSWGRPGWWLSSRVWQIPRILVKVHLCSNKNYWGLRRLLSNFWDPF